MEVAEQSEVDWLAAFLSFDDPAAARARAIALARGEPPPPWDGKHHLYQPARRRFPAGLLDSVRREASRAGIHLDVLDRRTPAPQRQAPLGFLRPYQQDALAACLARVRGVVKAPTGAGKTVVMAGLVASVTTQWVIAAPQVDLLRQTADRIREFTGEECGVVGDGAWQPARVTVATLQTLSERSQDQRCRQLVSEAGGLVVDECHVLGAASFYQAAMRFSNAVYRVGFSGTPFARGDGRSVYCMAALGPKIYEILAPELVERGVLSRPTIRMFPHRQVLPPNLSWQEVYRRGIVESESRNQAVVALARYAEKPCLVFVKEIDHGRILLRMLDRAGMRAGFVWGDTDSAGRQSAIKRLVRGDIDVLVSSTIFEQGVDIKEVRSAIVASGGKSAIRAVQRLGRIMRVTDGKNSAQLWDFDDMGQVWLDRHSGQRLAAYLKEGHSCIKVPREEAQLLLQKFNGGVQ